jgi:DNA-binding SARP family transcriptional activator
VAGGRPAAAGTTIVRVMGPVLALEHDGVRHVLPDISSRLLLALALAHPAPVNVESLSELLWPGIPLDRTRPRMSSALHRLRRSAEGLPDFVVRHGDLLSFSDGCEIDLCAYRRRLRDEATRALALVEVRDNLCEAQFPYEEGFVAERHRFVGEWLLHARDALAQNEVAVADLLPALTTLGLTAGDLTGTG